MLWQRALECPTAPPTAGSGAGAQNGLTYALATALSDLFAVRGGDELAAAALRILFDPRLAAWHDATAAEASRPPRVAAAAHRLLIHAYVSPCASLGVRACRLPASRAHSPLACAHFTALSPRARRKSRCPAAGDGTEQGHADARRDCRGPHRTAF